MSVSVPVGIDLGSGKTTLGVARNRGIDIVVNEVSNRATPSLVAFGPKCRFLGEAAKSQETSNLKNTVSSLKRLVGRREDDPGIVRERAFNGATLEPVNGETGVKVSYLGKPAEFTFTQLTAMYLGKMRSTLLQDTKGNINDVVIAVPSYFVDAQRRAVADAAVIAGLNPVRIVNDVSAAAIGHGVFRTDLPEDSYKKIAIVDIGYSDYTVSIVALKKGEGKVLGTSCERNFGGRDLDLVITQHFAREFASKYKIDVASNPKAFGRVVAQSEKLKKILSANTSGMFNVESLMNDIDVSSSLTREDLESYLADSLAHIKDPVAQALSQAGLTPDDLDAIELIGGCTRVPSIKQKISEAFGGKPLSYTMNQDEAVARGAAFLCAAHSPTVRVRPFKFEDINNHSVTFKWDKTEDEDTDSLEVFPLGSPFPVTKVVTLFRKQDFEIEAFYTHPHHIEEGISPHVGKWSIKGVKPASNGDAVAVKLKLRQDPSGLYTVESAYTAEEQVVQEPVEGSEEGETKEVKKWVKKDDLTIEHFAPILSPEQRDLLLEAESKMAAEDKLVADTEDRKNALEEYIYDIRDKVEGPLAEFASEEEKEKLFNMAMETEDWLYGDGEDASKGQYVAKYDELAALGNLIKGRKTSKEEEQRQAARAKQEAEQQRKMAEKMQEQKAAREAEQAKKAEQEKETAGNDEEMPDAQ